MNNKVKSDTRVHLINSSSSYKTDISRLISQINSKDKNKMSMLMKYRRIKSAYGECTDKAKRDKFNKQLDIQYKKLTKFSFADFQYDQPHINNFISSKYIALDFIENLQDRCLGNDILDAMEFLEEIPITYLLFASVDPHSFTAVFRLPKSVKGIEMYNKVFTYCQEELEDRLIHFGCYMFSFTEPLESIICPVEFGKAYHNEHAEALPFNGLKLI